MDFITCNAFVVMGKTALVSELSLDIINIRKDKILSFEPAEVVSEFGTFNDKGEILTGEVYEEFTRLFFDDEYFAFLKERIGNPLSCGITEISSTEKLMSSIVVDIPFTEFLDAYSQNFEGSWGK